MARLLLTRGASLIAILLVLSFVVFALQVLIPSDPARAFLGASATREAVARKRAQLGLDQPVPVQYEKFLTRVLHGDLGDSLRSRRRVTTDLRQFGPATAELALTSAVVAGILGVTVGVLGAWGGKLARVARLVLAAGASFPPFLIAILSILVFYRYLGWLPASGRVGASAPSGPTHFLLIDTLLRLNLGAFWDALQHLILPAFCLAIGPAVAIARTLRASLLGVLEQDYVRTARAKGISEVAVVLKHGLRNAINAPLTMAGLQAGLLLSGVVVVEEIFAWPGLGTYTVQAIKYADFPAIAGVTFTLCVAYVLVNFAVDVAQAMADPRIRA
jgi:peptide/nickel transport system permease protein